MAEETELKALEPLTDIQNADPLRKPVERTQFKNPAGWTKLLTFSGYSSTLGIAVPAGYCIGCMNSPAVFMRQWCRETILKSYDVDLSASSLDILWSTVVSIFLVGGAVGSLTGADIANRFGRKMSITLCALLHLTACLCFCLCRPLNAVSLLLAARFLVGLAAGLTTASLSMYLSEISPLPLRGTLGVFCAVGLTAGVVVGQVVCLRNVLGSSELWPYAMSAYSVLVVVCCGPIRVYPESPKWLYVMRGDKAAAERQLVRLRGSSKEALQQVADELAEMEAELQSGESEAGSFMEVLRDGRFLLPLVIVCAFLGGQQLTGINAIFYYSVSIFRKAGLSPQAAEWANLGAGSLNLAISLLGPLLMAKVNRRPLMLWSSAFCALALFMFAILLHFIDLVSWFAMACILCIFLYIFFFQFGLGPIPYFIGTELFEVAPRSVAMSMGSLSSWSCNFIIGMAFPSLQNAWGAFVFLPFSITCVLLFLLTLYYLPETRGKDPMEVAPLMAKGFRSKVRST